MMKITKTFFFALSCLFLAACGSERDAHAPSEWPPASFTFQVNGESAIIYLFTGGTMGNVLKGGTTQGVFSYQKTGSNSGTLTINFPSISNSEVFQLHFSETTKGDFNLSRTDTSSTPPLHQEVKGIFHKN